MDGSRGSQSSDMVQATRPKRRGLLPPEVVELLVPSLRVGAYVGAGGMVLGAGAAIVKGAHPVAATLASGGSLFLTGSAFWLVRSGVMRSMGGEGQTTPWQKVMVTSGAALTSGALMGLMRGPSNIIPSIIVWSIFGAAGQYAVNKYNARETSISKMTENLSWSKWSPLRRLTDQEYIDMLEEKKLKFDVDIALIEDRIAELREAEHRASLDEERRDREARS